MRAAASCPTRRLRWLVRASLLLLLGLTATAASAGSYSATADRDTWINEAQPSQTNGAAVALRATASSTGTSRTRALIGFTLPTIPSNERITSVVLRLRVTTAGTRVVNVHRITDIWAENTATWTNSNPDFNATSQASFTPSAVNTTISINVTSLVQGWAAGTFVNHGLVLIGSNSSAAQFASEDATTTTNRPQLVITTELIPPSLSIVKASSIVSDPLNNAVNPKFIPGATVRYTVGATNSTAGTVDNNTTIFTDAVPSGMQLFVGDLGTIGSGPVIFTNGSTSSGLTYSFASLSSTTDSLSFSNNGGTSFLYTPVPDSSGYDGNVTHVQITLSGTFAGRTGATSPSLSIQMLMKVR